MKRIRLLDHDDVVLPYPVLAELLAAGQDLRASAIAGGAHLVTPARRRWLNAEMAIINALAEP